MSYVTAMNRVTIDSFLNDVKDHKMTLCSYDPQSKVRHLRFQKHGTIIQSFQITSLPSRLIISGDMGDYIFARSDDDMFYWVGRDVNEINPNYMSAKVVSIDRRCGLSVFDHNVLKQVVYESVEERMEDQPINDRDKAFIYDKVNRMLSRCETEEQAYHELREFLLKVEDKYLDYLIIKFDEAWEWDFTRLSDNFLWCCYALAWGIDQYFEFCEAHEKLS